MQSSTILMADSFSRPQTPTEEADLSRSSSSPVDEVIEEPVEESPNSSGSTPRRTRSSGVPIEDKPEDVTTRRSGRRAGLLQNPDEPATKLPPGQTGIGVKHQTNIPDLIVDPHPEDEDDRAEVEWIPNEEFNCDINVRKFLEMARICRQVQPDAALKMIYKYNYNLQIALEEFEKLPLPKYLWNTEEIHSLVKKMSQGRTVAHMYKHFSEKYHYRDSRARVVEKRYELLHRVCLGESKWLCPNLTNRTQDELIISRDQCANCCRWLFELCPDTNPMFEPCITLCNACKLYAVLYRHYRPFSIKIENDEYVKRGFDKQIYKEEDEEHYRCFSDKELDEARKQVEWTTAERMIVVRGFRELGQDWEGISEKLPGRSMDDVISFYVEFRDRYNLDDLVANFEREQETPTNPRARRNAEDRTPTPNNEEDSAEEMDMDDSRNVRLSGRHPNHGTTVTTRNKARNAVESVA